MTQNTHISPPRPSERATGRLVDHALHLFACGESADVDGFISAFAEPCVYQFGNLPVCYTRSEIAASMRNFIAVTRCFFHGIKTMAELPDTLFIEMDVIYWRLDGSSVQLPVSDIVRFDGDEITELRIFMDASPVLEPERVPAADASVLTRADKSRDPLPGTMYDYFMHDPEGRARIERGLLPRWATDGPKWPLSETGTHDTQDA